ncbi:hypothetical protein DV736_g1329, partial [Chaetothyriales sp. CBS 134916]
MNEPPPSKRARRSDGAGKGEGEYSTSHPSPPSPRPHDSRRDDKSRSPARNGVNDGNDGSRSSFRHRSPPPGRSSRTTADNDRPPPRREKADKERKPTVDDNRSRVKLDPGNDVRASRANGEPMALDEDNEDALLGRMMGFTSFKTTQNTKVPGNQIYGVRKEKKTEYRQYMNRVGGFNRPLSPSR